MRPKTPQRLSAVERCAHSICGTSQTGVTPEVPQTQCGAIDKAVARRPGLPAKRGDTRLGGRFRDVVVVERPPSMGLPRGGRSGNLRRTHLLIDAKV